VVVHPQVRVAFVPAEPPAAGPHGQREVSERHHEQAGPTQSAADGEHLLTLAPKLQGGSRMPTAVEGHGFPATGIGQHRREVLGGVSQGAGMLDPDRRRGGSGVDPAQ
jgi:hypothetical protein